jgi:hypothetical protein
LGVRCRAGTRDRVVYAIGISICIAVTNSVPFAISDAASLAAADHQD